MNQEDNIILVNYLIDENEKYIKLNSELIVNNKFLNAQCVEYEKKIATLKNENDKCMKDLNEELKQKTEFLQEIVTKEEQLIDIKNECNKLIDMLKKQALNAKNDEYTIEHLNNKIEEREKRIKFLDENVIKPKNELIEKLTELLKQHNITIPEN